MVFGTAYLGKIKKIDSTYIETKFVVIGLPLFPVGSIIVSEKRGHTRTGVDIPLHSISVFAAYARMITFWVGSIAFLFGAGNPDHGINNSNLIIQLTGAGFLLLWALLYFRFGKASLKEVVQWRMVKEATGIAALPGWLNYNERIRSLRSLEFLFTLKYNTDWQTAVCEKTTSLEQLRLIYKIVLFRLEIDVLPADQQLLNKIAIKMIELQKQATNNKNNDTNETTFFGNV